MNFQYETERLNIRILSSDFAGKTLEFHQNNRSTFEKYDGGKPENFYTLPYQKSLLQCEYQMMLQQKAIRFWLFEKGNPDHIIGTMSIQRISRGIFQSCVIGYKMDAAYRDMDYMTEALHFLISFIFTELKLHRIEAYVNPDNNASIHLLKKLEFTEEGIAHGSAWIQGVWQDHLRFALISGPKS